MHKQSEYVYLGRDNTIDLSLTENGVALTDLTPVTRMILNLNDVVVDSDIEIDAFDWTTGTLILSLGNLITPLIAGSYSGQLITYDIQNPNGIVWITDMRIIVE